MDSKGDTFGISRTSGVLISLAAIAATMLLVLALVSTVLPSARNDAIGVLVASVIIPVMALFRPLQEFAILPDGLEFRIVFSKRGYKLLWKDITDVRLKQDVLGVTNLEFRKKDRRMYRKIPLSIIPGRRQLLHRLLERFPVDHPRRGLLEHLVHAYVG